MWLRRIFGASNRGSDRPVSTDASEHPVVDLSPQAFRQLNRMQLNAGRFLPGFSTGNRPSLRRKPTTEFRDHRPYTPGDDIRLVDWKVSARQEHISIRQGELPKEASIYLVVDCSASMGWGEPPKYHTAFGLTAALGYLALAQGDRLTVIPMTQEATTIFGPISGKGQFPVLLSYLRKLPIMGSTNLPQAIYQFSRAKAQRGGMIFILSDLLQMDQMADVLKYLPAPTWDVVILHLLHSEEIAPTLRGEFEMQDIETGKSVNYDVTPKDIETYSDRVDSWCKLLEMGCVENNAFYTQIRTDSALDGEILPHLRNVNVIKPI